MLQAIFFAVLLALPPIAFARAQAPPEALRDFVMTKAGETVRIWTFFDCADPKGMPGAFGSAANGTIIARRATEFQCGNREQPVVQVFYTPREGFFGEDDAVLRGPRGQEVQIKVRVSQPPQLAEPAAGRVQPVAEAPAETPAAAPPRTATAARAKRAAAPQKVAAAPSRSVATPTRSATKPRARTARASGCPRKRGEAAILRVLRCELAGSKAGNRRRYVRVMPESAR
jgi:hypothetical protein